ncbi:hypothetical protein RSAG8_12643, partial [Rhizoctonia solani AG-8 WAC10335]
MARIKKGEELEGEEAKRYLKQHPRTLKKILEKAEKAVGAQALIFLMTQESSTKRNITVLSSDGFREFSKSTSTEKLVTSLKAHVQKTSANAPKPTNRPPRPCIYPDRERNDKPSVPDLAGLRASDLQDIHRDYWRQLLAYMGGGSRFPWEEIAKDPGRWLGGKLPGDFKDPGGHDRDGNLVWLECLLAGQKDDIPPADRIFICRIHTADPIDPSESEEPVTKCHTQKALTWPDESLLYANYIRTGPIARSYLNPHQLPICPDTKTHLDEVLGLIDAYNEFASHLPAETVPGAWAGQPVPLLFSVKPPTQAPTANFFLRVYLPLSYYQSIIQAQKEGTLHYFEMWIELILSGKLLFHGPSSTLLGGITVSKIFTLVVLGIVLTLFNVAYVRGDAKPPFSPPEDYDLTRLSASEWDRVRKWCHQLTKVLNESTQVLSLTSLHRLKGAVPMARAPVDDDLAFHEDPVQTDLLDTNATQNAPTSPKPPKTSDHRKSTRKKTKGKKPRRVGSDSTDYDRKDESDEGPSEDESQLGVDEGTHGLDAGGGNVKSIRQLLPKDFEPSECPWGNFPDPRVHVDLPRYIAPETLLPPMQSAYDELDAALQEWHQSTLMAENLHVERSYRVQERNNPVLSDPRIGPMYVTILTCELVWNVRKAQGKVLYPVLERLKIASSTVVQHSLAWVELIKSTESLGDEGPDLGKLDNLGRHLRAKIAKARWTYDEMIDYAHLAMAMEKKMDWFPDPQQRPAPDSPDIRECAVWCMEWAKATEELEGEMMSHRRGYWCTAGQPFEKEFTKPSWYKFGNAVKEEWHQALEACLTLSVAPVSTSALTIPIAAPNPAANVGATDESATARPEEEPTIDEMEQDPQENAMAKETGPDKSTEATISSPGPDASHSTAGKATTSAFNTRGRKSGPAKQAVEFEPCKTRAVTKWKAEEAQPIRKSQRTK